MKITTIARIKVKAEAPIDIAEVLEPLPLPPEEVAT